LPISALAHLPARLDRLPFIFAASTLVLGLGKDRTFAIAGRRLPFAQLFGAVLICLALIDFAYNGLRLGRIMT
jgi:hypothetical protein